MLEKKVRVDRVYTIKKLAKFASVTVRTLQYYDQTGLLKPSKRNSSNYRIYNEKELLKLQQILFFRELDFPLSEIEKILNNPEFDQVSALKEQRNLLLQKGQRVKKLIRTIDKTLLKLQGENTMLKDEELYEGFSKEEIEQIKKEVKEKYDPKIVKQSQQRVSNMTKVQWQAVKEEGGKIYNLLASLMGLSVSDTKVQDAVQQHFKHIGNFYDVTPEIYRGLGDLYVSDARFTAFYEKIKPGLAQYMKKAMHYFCDHSLAGKEQ